MSAPSVPGIDLQGIGQSVAESIFSGMTGWLDGWLEQHGPLAVLRAVFYGLGWAAQRLLVPMAATMGGSSDLDVLSRVQEGFSVGDPTVVAVQTAARALFGGIAGLACLVMGFSVLLSFGTVNGRAVAGFFPRLAIAAQLLYLLPDLMRGGVAAANEIGSFLARGQGSLAGVIGADLSPEEAGGQMAAIAAMAAILFVTRFLLHALLGLSAMVGPIAVAAIVYAPWQGWFEKWVKFTVTLLAGAALQHVVMAAGASMFGRAMSESADDAQRALTAGSVAVATMAVAIAAPALLGGAVAAASLLGFTRRVVAPVRMREKHRETPELPAATAAAATAGPPPSSATAPAATASAGAPGATGGPATMPPEDYLDAEFVPRPAPPVVYAEPIYSEVPRLTGAPPALPDRAPRNYLSE